MKKTIEWQGKPVGFPGVYHGMPLDFYHSANAAVEPSISSSGLRAIFNKSPAHYWDSSPLNPERAEDEEEKKAFVLGRAAHHWLLGEADFFKLFALRPDQWDSWRTNAAKDWRDEQRANGFTVLEPAQFEQIQGMANALKREPLIQAGILDGYIERSMFWKDAKTGIWLKSRPDAVPADAPDFADLKGTPSVAYQDLQRTIANFGYHAQGALVRAGARELLKYENITFSLVFVEWKRPHCVRVVTLKDSDLDLGARQNRWALDTFAKCMAEKHWPGPGGDQRDAEYIELPEIKQKQITDQLNILGG